MTAVISPEAAREILAEVDACTGSDRELDRIAGDHGLFLAELRTLLARRTTAPAPAPVAPETKRVCSQCGVEKPIEEFYVQKDGRGGRMAACTSCNNSRPPTESRMVRNRARSRAYATLAKRHEAEFTELFLAELEAARVEHSQVQQAAAQNHDAKVARLKPGPRRAGEQSTTERLDVARCRTCHTHHDVGHECPNCGDTTPADAPVVKPWQIRAWASEQGIAVPVRGPIPERVRSAYDAAHPEAS